MISYMQEGDRVLLKATERELRMKRSNLLEMHFVPSQVSHAEIFFGAQTGSFQLLTSFYSFQLSVSGGEIALDYELQFPQAVQKFSLIIAIQNISEAL